MCVEAKIILDSVAPSGCRLTTFQIRIPKCLLAELNTHRALSRNAASSRAIPVQRVIEQVDSDPCIPSEWRRNERGMQGYECLDEIDSRLARSHWKNALNSAVTAAWFLSRGLNAHKQHVNRLLEPFMWADVVVSATDWQNFFRLRCHHTAQPEMQQVATLMRDLYQSHKPSPIEAGDWHLPYLLSEERDGLPLEDLLKIATARIARVSYANHENGQIDHQKDFALHDRLLSPDPNDPTAPPHASPFEHCAKSLRGPAQFGNFRGWAQYRKFLPEECVREPKWSFENPGEVA